MHPQLGYQLALDRGRELQAAAESDRLARSGRSGRSVRNPGGRRWYSKSTPPVGQSTPAAAFPATLSAVLDEVAIVVEDLGPAAITNEAIPVVVSLVEEVLTAAKEAGLTGLPDGLRPNESAVVGYRTLANVGSRIHGLPEIVLARPDARRIGFVIADLRALERQDPSTRPDPVPSPHRRLLKGRLARIFGPLTAERSRPAPGADCVPGLPVCC